MLLGEVCGIDGPVTGITFSADSGKKKILLLKPKDREAPNVPDGVSEQQGASSPAANTPGSTASRQGQRRKAGGKLIRSILLRNDAGQNQSSAAVQPQQETQAISPDTVKKPPHPTNTRMGMNGSGSEKHEKRTRNKDRPDRGVWSPRTDFSQSSEERLTSSVLQSAQSSRSSMEVTQGEMKCDIANGSIRCNIDGLIHAGSNQQFGRGPAAHNIKDDRSVISSEVKPSKRGGPTSTGAHEKQVWVQKSPSGS